MKINLCIPRLRSSNNNGGNNYKSKTPAITLLERCREAVFRLIMLSALSKATGISTTTAATAAANTTSRNDHRRHMSRSYCYLADPHHSEAVADCIEFIKKKALTHCDDGDDDDDADSIDDATNTELVMPVSDM